MLGTVNVRRGGFGEEYSSELSVFPTSSSYFDASTIKVFFIKETYTYTSNYTRTRTPTGKGRENQGILCFRVSTIIHTEFLLSSTPASKRPPLPSPPQHPVDDGLLGLLQLRCAARRSSGPTTMSGCIVCPGPARVPERSLGRGEWL